jgi:hypothetical protein
MAVFDVTRVVAHTESVYDRFGKRAENIKSLVDWLTENVGDYYGRGENHVRDEEEDTKNQGNAVLHIGSGWQLERDWRGDPNGYVEVWWKVDITDEAKASFFALKWIK